MIVACAVGWAEPVALWSFDEPRDAPANSVLHDTGPNGYAASLGSAARIGPGRFGNALHPFARAHERSEPARAVSPATLMTRAIHVRPNNPTDTKLNLGEADWTVEFWMWLEADATEEGVVFEIGAGAVFGGEFRTQLSVLPREDAFVLTGLVPPETMRSGTAGKRVEFPNPEGPPASEAFVLRTTVAASDPLPRATWAHVALVHSHDAGHVALFVNGRPRAVAGRTLRALPRSDSAYLALGCTGGGDRPFPGALDELRFSDEADYTASFTPPGASVPVDP